jgi:hypothetical protein
MRGSSAVQFRIDTISLRMFFLLEFSKQRRILHSKRVIVLLQQFFIIFSEGATKISHCFTPVVFQLSLGAVRDSISDAVGIQKVVTMLWQISRIQSQLSFPQSRFLTEISSFAATSLTNRARCSSADAERF